MPSKSKTKGSTWERDVAMHLSKLYQDSFIRVPNSGAYVGGKNAVRKDFLHEGQIRAMKGDIIPPLDWKYFNCECKNYADFPFHQLVASECKQLEKWLSQILDCADPNDINILIMKITRKGKFIAVEAGDHWDFTVPHFTYFSKEFGSWHIFDYDTFWHFNSNTVKQLSINSIG